MGGFAGSLAACITWADTDSEAPSHVAGEEDYLSVRKG